MMSHRLAAICGIAAFVGLVSITADSTGGAKPQGQPFQALQNQIDALASQVAGLQAQIDGIPPPDPQIAFVASLSTDFPISPATVNDPFIVIPFDNAVLNDGSAYSSPSFSAPVSGVYYFDVTVLVESGTDARLVLTHLDASGGDVAEYSLQAGNNDNRIRQSGGITLNMAVDESIVIRLYDVNEHRVVFGEVSVSEVISFFSGHLVYATDS